MLLSLLLLFEEKISTDEEEPAASFVEEFARKPPLPRPSAGDGRV
jgi:hypothetical protein